MSQDLRHLSPGHQKPIRSFKELVESALKLYRPQKNHSWAPRTAAHHLTHCQFNVLKGILHGKSNKQIGADLFVTEKTVKFHVTALNKKIGSKNRHEMMTKVFTAASEVRRSGICSLPTGNAA
jgi:DNA-binding NarL/FixJ family response regulator